MNIELIIDGMHCSGCANAVRRALAAVPSVSAVTVDLGAGRASVEAEAGIDPAKLLSAAEEAGYEARIGANPADQS
ncbi:heavy metal-associated domain-containing protein [Mesorhizobium sp. KR9-304]|uniref:heavy-metal-associated domain-containing protein n=1 Tax=Mesorhizobium sp. KR9-304 TaxID=3156614 RepID=UPI0032B35E5E